MSEQHTPGPWMVSAGTDVIRDHDTLTHLGWANGWSGATPDEARANARLMAAAPDLLAACEDTLAYLARPLEARWQDIDQATTALRRVIAQARGDTDE